MAVSIDRIFQQCDIIAFFVAARVTKLELRDRVQVDISA